jgi:hypothetical protein
MVFSTVCRGVITIGDDMVALGTKLELGAALGTKLKLTLGLLGALNSFGNTLFSIATFIYI